MTKEIKRWKERNALTFVLICLSQGKGRTMGKKKHIYNKERPGVNTYLSKPKIKITFDSKRILMYLHLNLSFRHLLYTYFEKNCSFWSTTNKSQIPERKIEQDV